MKIVKQVFSKGVNRRINKELSSAERLHTLQNARLNADGNTLSVSRVKGNSRWADENEGRTLGLGVFSAEFNTEGFTKTVFLRFQDGVRLRDTPPNVGSDYVEVLDVDDVFDLRLKRLYNLKFIEQVVPGDFLPFPPRGPIKLSFVESLTLREGLLNTQTFKLSFVEGLTVVDTPICG